MASAADAADPPLPPCFFCSFIILFINPSLGAGDGELANVGLKLFGAEERGKEQTRVDVRELLVVDAGVASRVVHVAQFGVGKDLVPVV